VLVILFGLFNGLVFLPVILGIIGPKGSGHGTPSPEEVEPLAEVNHHKSDNKASNGQGGGDFEMKSLVI